ncbi:translocation/assembly module TamB domain-containing protein [Neisseriaceae bacterium ESL0693]|nr:translocation/assembly module TamB domain-containing protein [Neisseriaceae bacterium ESL0693]
MTQHTHTPAEDQTRQKAANIPAPPPPALPQSRWWRILKKILWGMVIILALTVTFSFWLIGTHSGLRFGVLTVPGWLGIQSRVDDLSGSIWQGFSGKNWHFKNPKFQLDISRLRFNWRHQELWHRHLHITDLQLGQVHFINTDTAPKPTSPPLTLPKSIRLPVRITVDALSIEALTLGKDHQSILLPSQISYVYDHRQHQLNVTQLATPWHTVTGALRLDTQSPFTLQGQLSGHGQLDKTQAESHITLGGSLKQPAIKAKLQGEHVSLQLQTELRPFAQQLNQKIVFLLLDSEHLNPAAFTPTLPQADISLHAHLTAAKNQPDALTGTIQLQNHQARAYNADTQTSIPVRSINGQIQIDQSGQMLISGLTARLLKQGQITLNGHINNNQQQVDLSAQLTHIAAQDILRDPLAGQLNGNIHVHGSFQALQTDWLFNTGEVNSQGRIGVHTDPQNRQQTLSLDQLIIKPNNGGSIQATGHLALYQDKALQLSINANQFNPARLNQQFPAGKINSNIELNGRLADKPDIQAKIDWKNSILSGQPLTGKSTLHYQHDHLKQADIHVLLGKNRINTQGSFGLAKDRLNLDIYAPNLDLFGFGLHGLLTAKGFVTGEPQKLTANLSGSARQVSLKQLLHVDNLDFNLEASPDVKQPLKVNIKGQNIRIGQDKAATTIKQISLNLNGHGNQHQLRLLSDITAAGKPYHTDIQAQGGLDPQYQWRGRINVLNIAGALNIQLLAPIQLEAGSQKILLDRARFAALGGSLNIHHLNWLKDKGIVSQGQADRLDLRELHHVIPLPIEQNLILGGDWNFAYNNNMQGYLKMYQQSGDIILPLHQQPLGLSQVKLETRFQQGRINNHLSGHTRYGDVDATLNIMQQYGKNMANAPISGNIKINSTDLSNTRNLLPIGMQLKGALKADANIRGSLSSPLLSGHLNGNNLYYRDQSTGAILENGRLNSHFDGRRWVIDQLNFTRQQGQINLTGVVDMTKLTPDVNVTAHFNHYMVLDKINSRLTLSGNAQLLYTIAHGIALTGQLQVDQSSFGFQKSGMPKLDDDVVVLGRENPQIEQRPTPIRMDLVLNLNDAFRFNTDGIDVILGGQLNAKANPGENIQVIGTVNVVKGQYKAYGQDLVIQRGSTVSFVGPIDTPNLKIRAKRRYSQVGAGVEALGSLNNPRINLIANEPMSEKDKLSWLILNRASSGSAGDEAAIAAAASAWLAGGLNNRLGLFDEIGLTSQQTRNSQTGEMNPAEQAITIGKHISNNLYISYLYGIESATQTISLAYQISRTLQSIVQFSTESIGGGLRYTHRFD